MFLTSLVDACGSLLFSNHVWVMIACYSPVETGAGAPVVYAPTGTMVIVALACAGITNGVV